MDLIKLTDKSFNERLIENDVAEVLLLRFLDNLGFQQEIALFTDLILKILAHQIGQESSNLKLDISRHRAHKLVIQVQMLLNLAIELITNRFFSSRLRVHEVVMCLSLFFLVVLASCFVSLVSPLLVVNNRLS